MKATELRIGNWVAINERQFQTNLDGIKTAHRLDPISLTEEWLESTNIDGTSFGAELCFTIWTEGNKIYLEQYGEGRVLLDHIKYRHQVQNFYHALTGEELQTDETEQIVNL